MMPYIIRGVMVTVVGNRHRDPCSKPGRGCFILHSANTLEKNMNLTILPK